MIKGGSAKSKLPGFIDPIKTSKFFGFVQTKGHQNRRKEKGERRKEPREREREKQRQLKEVSHLTQMLTSHTYRSLRHRKQLIVVWSDSKGAHTRTYGDTDPVYIQYS